VRRALQLCARDQFVPGEHREEALVDAPIRVERHDFNISAPHMHATCLEALQLQPGHRVRRWVAAGGRHAPKCSPARIGLLGWCSSGV
jgi:protein-L-isoaspartate O-methyltransferase